MSNAAWLAAYTPWHASCADIWNTTGKTTCLRNARRCIVRRLLVVLCLSGSIAALWSAARSAAFNANVSSPALVRSLAIDYLAVDLIYGGSTSPASVDAALRRLTPPPTSFGGDQYRPGAPVARSDDGLRLAQQAEQAVAGLGATAELIPVRQELGESYGNVEAAWRLELQVEHALDHRGAVAGFGYVDATSAQQAAATSLQRMRQARALHDQAIAAVHALAPAAQSATVDSAGDGLGASTISLNGSFGRGNGAPDGVPGLHSLLGGAFRP